MILYENIKNLIPTIRLQADQLCIFTLAYCIVLALFGVLGKSRKVFESRGALRSFHKFEHSGTRGNQIANSESVRVKNLTGISGLRDTIGNLV